MASMPKPPKRHGQTAKAAMPASKPGAAGGLLGKAPSLKAFGHPPQPVANVATDRGAFRIKG